MTLRRQALIVAPDADLGTTLAEWLAAAGYNTVVVRTFAAARSELDTATPDLLITELKLGAYNGLHLAIRARSRRAHVPIVVIGAADPVVQNEAERQQAAYLTKPIDQQQLLNTIRKIEADYRPTRRSPRKRVAMLDALVDNVRARVLDVSYEGMRLQLAEKDASSPAPYFTLQIPTFNLNCRAQRVWTQTAPDDAGVWCGAALVGGDPAGAVAWRALVDSVPGWTLLAN